MTSPSGRSEPGPGGPVPVRYVADAVVACVHPGEVLRPGVVEVRGDTVTHVGPVVAQTGDRSTGHGEEVRVHGALLPGLVNVHCHSPMTLFRGSGENLPLSRWLREVLWPQEAHLTEEDVYWGMSLAAAELLRFGVTTTCEAYFHEDALADAVIDAGSRALVTPGVLQLPGDAPADHWWIGRTREIADFHRRRHGDHDRIEVGFAPHAAYTVPMAGLVHIAEAACDLDALFHIHLAETEEECRLFAQEHGDSMPAVLARAGVFGGRVLAAHSIWLSDADIDLYRQFDVAVAHCPQSNAKLASGVAPLVALLAQGIRVGLATDGPASNNDLDLWEEMRLAAMLARIRERDAAALSAAAALDLATRGAGAGPRPLRPRGAGAGGPRRHDRGADRRPGVRAAAGGRPDDRPPGVVGLQPPGHRRVGGRGAGGGVRAVPHRGPRTLPPRGGGPGPPAAAGGRLTGAAG